MNDKLRVRKDSVTHKPLTVLVYQCGDQKWERLAEVPEPLRTRMRQKVVEAGHSVQFDMSINQQPWQADVIL